MAAAPSISIHPLRHGRARCVPRAFVAGLLLQSLTWAVFLRAAAQSCGGALAADQAAACAVAHSPDVQLARLEARAIQDRRRSAGRLLPSHPVVSLALADRRGPAEAGGGAMTAPTALNWYVTLTQELEIAGQRGTRLAVVDAEVLV